MQTCRHIALYMYLARVLRPVWELHAINRPSLRKMSDLRSNYDLFVPLKSRLESMLQLVQNNFANLHGLSGRPS